jgi:hypothetical protein
VNVNEYHEVNLNLTIESLPADSDATASLIPTKYRAALIRSMPTTTSERRTGF